MEQERRRAPRYPFSATAEFVKEGLHDKATAQVSELSLNGCYLETENPPSEGTALQLKIFRDREFFEAQATVIFARPGHGIGVAFREVKPYFAGALKRWLLAAMMGREPHKN